MRSEALPHPPPRSAGFIRLQLTAPKIRRGTDAAERVEARAVYLKSAPVGAADAAAFALCVYLDAVIQPILQNGPL